MGNGRGFYHILARKRNRLLACIPPCIFYLSFFFFYRALSFVMVIIPYCLVVFLNFNSVSNIVIVGLSKL